MDNPTDDRSDWELPGDEGYDFEEFFHQHFETALVRLDGKAFYDCTFQRVSLVYEGKAPFKAIGCDFDQYNLVFAGAAARAVQFLSGWYHLNGDGAVAVEKVFNHIRGGQLPPAQGGNRG